MVGGSNYILTSLNYPKTWEPHKNPICSWTHNFCNNYGNKSCHFVGRNKLTPIDYGVLFKHKYHSDALTESIDCSIVSKT